MDITFIEALELLLLQRRQDENEYNMHKRNQATEFKSMLIAAKSVMGDKEAARQAEEHMRDLKELEGTAREQQAQAQMAQYQWPKEMEAALKQRQAEGR